jgi:hypothetical protein
MRDTSIYPPARRRAGLVLSFLFTCTGLCWLTGTATFAAQDKPATIQEVSYIAPSTLAQMLQSSDLVARVRITEAKQNVVVGVADAGIFTDLVATVVEPYKVKTTPVAAGAPIRILQEGGEAQVGSKRLRIVADFERLTKGKEYVLFLTWSKPSNAYQVNYGPDGAFEVARGQKLRAIGKSPAAQEQAGADIAAFQDKLQGLIAQKR